jgi:hypothetical protein
MYIDVSELRDKLRRLFDEEAHGLEVIVPVQ